MAVAWSLLFWLLMFFMNFAFIVSSFYQLLCLLDLEGDHMNPFEASAHINFWVMKEFLLHGVFCILLLVTGHWLIFLVAVPLASYHALLYMKRQHLVDVTEVFRNLKGEKNLRLFKLGFYVVFFVIVVFNLAIATFEAVLHE
ncbi:protein cornichon homolog 1-like isoform X2 [Mangifera indica]|uniref:protein cornichon homolog 1-like isoform X2 n=1 Tax=Mangifera indica TaxID=29780 RepID=UPI001CFA7AC4|nr:protein cornichon homolog 1-like isoform X2 [Mangifera indica]XP_044469010.1 protein cornichon homolog 1-like isoform X2 [Mangifera indica]XP_044469013.1 protein cornichon homolog 1-like isoform X2 [Mangifera indica]